MSISDFLSLISSQQKKEHRRTSGGDIMSLFTGARRAACRSTFPHRPRLSRRRRRSRTAASGRSSSSSSSSASASSASAAETSDAFSSVVPNTGSTARDHLANERTFLAWSRTGLTFVGLGVAIDSLLRVSASVDDVAEQQAEQAAAGAAQGKARAVAEPSGDRWKMHVPASGLVLTGGSVLTYATVRYYRVQRCLQQGTFPLNRVGMGTVIVGTSLLTLASLMMTVGDDLVDTSAYALGQAAWVESPPAAQHFRRRDTHCRNWDEK